MPVNGKQSAVQERTGKPGQPMNDQIPEMNATHAAAARPDFQERTAGNSDITIMLVDDDDSVREAIRQILETFDYSVLEACDAGQAIEVARNHANSIELLISDVVMPGMNGMELYQYLLVRRPSLKAIFISGYAMTPLSPGEQGELALHYMQKPFRPNALLERIRLLL